VRDVVQAVYPVASGYAVRDGVRLYYEVYGEGARTILLLPAWSIVHSRHWKMQIAFLARRDRVLLFDGRGNGRSDRPPSGYGARSAAADTLAVMDATGTESAVLVSLSIGAQTALVLAGEHGERVEGSVFLAPTIPIGAPYRTRPRYPFDEPLDSDEGWATYNRHYWMRDHRGFLEFFFGEMFPEPHSAKAIEDGVRWGLETTPETLIATEGGESLDTRTALQLCRQLRCPALVVHGSDDRITGPGPGVALAEAIGAPRITLEGAGHGLHVRHPVKVNRLLREFLDR
jgi:pimeloyl-ACP methyl ester carboxylesterase